MANSRSGDSVIDRLVRVLATFDAEHTAQTPSEIARRAELPASTGHRLVADLIESGLLERDEDGRARVGMRLWELATRGSLALGLRQAALPAMEKVQAALRQHTQLGVFDDDQVLFLERLSHPDAGANIARIAGRLPLHASSSGLVLLAGIAVPVRDRGVVVAALGVVLPREDADEHRAVAVLRAAAREIEQTLTRSPSAFG
jgi:DNA-binding IclR family transcriptional regulator